jgi:glycosidase
LKVIIDIVPNHVARNYKSLSNPAGTTDFGAKDDTTVEYARDNNFYYVIGKPFEVPNDKNVTIPLGGETHPLADGKFDENPAKWTGNGSREAKPMAWDWYETVKINYGVKPDGTHDFDSLPASFAAKNYAEHYAFWQDKSVPDSWIKFRDIALYWTEKGIDGFRFDMAEMVPVEFWSFMNSAIKMKNPDAFLLAEVYNPTLYRDYIHIGKMDYLYDKVALYDTLKNIIQGHGSTDNLPAIQQELADIEHHMLHFLENHDEQRIASDEFAGSAEKAKPAMVVSACISTSPTMIYFGQEVGEPSAENAGFGSESRTTIFDYWGVPNHQRWMNNGAFDGGQLSENEKALRSFYAKLLNFTLSSQSMTGHYMEIHSFNRANTENYNDKLFSFVRWKKEDKAIILSNFDENISYVFNLELNPELIKTWKLTKATYELTDALSDTNFTLTIQNNRATIKVEIKPLQSFILTF